MSRLVDALGERGCLRGEHKVSNADIDTEIADLRVWISVYKREIVMLGGGSLTEPQQRTKTQRAADILELEARIKEFEGWKT